MYHRDHDDSDRNPPVYDPAEKTVTMPEAFTKSYTAWMDAEWWRLQIPEELGGQVVVTNTGLITAGRYAPGSAVQVAVVRSSEPFALPFEIRHDAMTQHRGGQRLDVFDRYGW